MPAIASEASVISLYHVLYATVLQVRNVRARHRPADSGAPLNPSNIRNRNLRLLTGKAGLPTIRFHDLRHTCATLLLSKNVHPKIVQEILGHATVAITLDTYSHVLPGMGDQAAAAMEDVLL